MLTEITCGPISESAVEDEISFICSLFRDACPGEVSVMYGWACNVKIDALWEPKCIAVVDLSSWILGSIQNGIYEPGSSDLFIEDRERLKVLLCHEADIHITTKIKVIIERCASRWLQKGYSMHRSDEVPADCESWREVQSVGDATAGM
jgi:hypothetical protein